MSSSWCINTKQVLSLIENDFKIAKSGLVAKVMIFDWC
jgi:hypothetical protein